MTSRKQPDHPPRLPHTTLNKRVNINSCIIVEKSKRRDYSRYDYLLFVYFLILPFLLHSSILFNCFLYLYIYRFMAYSLLHDSFNKNLQLLMICCHCCTIDIWLLRLHHHGSHSNNYLAKTLIPQHSALVTSQYNTYIT